MYKGIAIFFSLILFCSSCKEFLQLGLFKLNRDYIASGFYSNKNKPQLKCDGKCYLKKYIAKSTIEKEGNQAVPSDDKSPVILCGMPPIPTERAQKANADSGFAFLAFAGKWMPAETTHLPHV